ERPICFKLFTQEIRCALALAFARAGSSRAARMAIMAMTTSNSIKVKPRRRSMVGLKVMAWFALMHYRRVMTVRLFTKSDAWPRCRSVMVAPFCLLALAAGDLAITGAEPKPANSRPNILFCLADDWAWPHAGVYGDHVVK